MRYVVAALSLKGKHNLHIGIIKVELVVAALSLKGIRNT